jgi:hypothetical protein
MSNSSSTIEARPEDVASVESIVHTAYEMLSGKATDKRDWDRWRTLHAPGARLIPIERAEDGTVVARVMTPDEFIASRSPFLSTHDFYEWETASEQQTAGRLVHRWSSYDGALERGGPPIRRGVNSIQLWNDGSRWWILSISWDTVAAIEAAEKATGG